MSRYRLTTGRVRDFNLPENGTSNQAFLWDSEVPGLGVRATKKAKSYIYQGRLNGESLRIKIGDVRTWLIDSKDSDKPGARQEARRLQALIDTGIDPRIEKQDRLAIQAAKKAESNRQEATVTDAWNEYIEDRRDHWSERHLFDHLDLSKKGGQKAKVGNKKIKAGPLAKLMPLKLPELTPEKVETWGKTEAAKRGARTRLAYNLLRAFINWCNDHPKYKGMAAPNACNPKLKERVIPKQKPKNDCLQREQLKFWFSAVQEYPNPVISAYLQSILLTGARREELAVLKWVDVDFKWNSLTIHDKIEGERTIPLTPYVAYLLSSLHRRNKWVFSSPGAKSGRIMEPRHAHNKTMLKTGIEGLTIHGLRRSFGTLSEWVECPVGVVAQIMGHKPSAIAEKHYRRRPLDLLRKWHVKIEAWILEQAGIDQPESSDKGLRVVKSAS